MLKVLLDSSEIKEAYDKLAQHLRKGGEKFRRTVGWPHGNRDCVVFWHKRDHFWVTSGSYINDKYYWIAYGTQNPQDNKMLSITCEANPPKEGAYRRCAGVLLRDSNGALFLGHSGKVGGGRKGVGKQAFLESFRGKMQPVIWVENGVKETAEVIVLGRISGADLIPNLARFIVDVDNFKKEVATEMDTDSLVEKESEKAETRGEFDFENLVDAREKVLATVVARRGQPEFRKKLLGAYGHRCAITNCDCPHALEAAHVQGYLGVETNKINNGILLRGDVHTLFDLRKISFADDYRVIISDNLKDTVYAKLHGKRLRLPTHKVSWPDIGALKKHRSGMSKPLMLRLGIN